MRDDYEIFNLAQFYGRIFFDCNYSIDTLVLTKSPLLDDNRDIFGTFATLNILMSNISGAKVPPEPNRCENISRACYVRVYSLETN